jgi:hypothetical protein
MCDATHKRTGEQYRLDMETVHDPYREPLVERKYELRKLEPPAEE